MNLHRTVVARAQRLAGHATGEPTRARFAEQALVGCLTDERQLAQITDAGLCHGWAGLAHTAHRADGDATNKGLTAAAHAITDRMRRHVRERRTPTDDGFLTVRRMLAAATSRAHPSQGASLS